MAGKRKPIIFSPQIMRQMHDISVYLLHSSQQFHVDKHTHTHLEPAGCISILQNEQAVFRPVSGESRRKRRSVTDLFIVCCLVCSAVIETDAVKSKTTLEQGNKMIVPVLVQRKLNQEACTLLF